MEPRKHAICEALSHWINQRPGFELGNYDLAGYRADSRRVQQQRRDALRLLMEVTRRDTLTADDLLKASQGAFSGRLTIAEGIRERPTEYTSAGGNYFQAPTPATELFADINYCTGQYWCTEYRAAACAVLASALWDWTREHAMPTVGAYRVESWSQLGKGRVLHTAVAHREAAEIQLKDLGGSDYGSVCELYSQRGPCERITWVSGGDWLRAHFAHEFGRGIAQRWFR